MMASAQVVETSVNTNNSPSQDYITNPDDHSNHNNGKTAEPEYYRRVAKAKERMGGKSFSGCEETISLANQVVGNTMAIVF